MQREWYRRSVRDYVVGGKALIGTMYASTRLQLEITAGDTRTARGKVPHGCYVV
jgi:hypothetical protein